MKNLLLFFTLFASALLGAEPPPPVGKTTPLFDGKTLAGWEGSEKWWRVEDGVIHGGSLTETVPHNDFLASVKDYSDFIIRFKIKLSGTEGFINSGFQIRSQRVPNNHEMSGYQCDWGEPNWYGCVYDESRRNKVMAQSDMAALRPVIKKDDWNEYVIRAEGPRITTWINGVQGADYSEADPKIPLTGKFGMQVHGGGKALVQFKEITIEELPARPRFEQAPEPKKGAHFSPLLPQDQLATFSLPPGFEIELVAAEDPANEIGKFVCLAFDQRGALWTTTALEYPVDGNENPAAAEALYASKAKDKVLVFDRDPKSPTGLASKPRVFLDGLAIPLGLLPYKSGCYVQSGHDIAFAEDTDGDGKADKRTVILTGFGVQDSHLFPHQFLRAPGGWIWMAQGAFNYGKVRRPDDPPERAIQFDQTRMAKFRPDGSEFTITSNGPCNIWGLVLDGEGQAWIQEANDYGYPVMPFHEYANYPGCSDAQWKSYAPEFPGTAPDFRMGGTGLSGLALSDKAGAWPAAYADVMFVANPIVRKIQAIKITPDGPRFAYRLLGDFIHSADEWFRPVAIAFGPDGCLYIVDWYNKIISHNEVPRNHPERDKTRGRIWRVKHKNQTLFPMQDFTKATGEELISKLGGPSLTQSHLAWQALSDRADDDNDAEFASLNRIVHDEKEKSARRVQALWVLRERGRQEVLSSDVIEATDQHVFREAIPFYCNFLISWLSPGASVTPPHPFRSESGEFVRLFSKAKDPSSVREAISGLGRLLDYSSDSSEDAVPPLIWNLAMHILPPLAEPIAPATRNGKPIKVREAYEREFERYLVRMFLERHPIAVAKFLSSPDAQKLPIESRLLASLALEPKASASRVAQLLPKLTRPPGQEEVLRLAQFLDEPGVGDALKATLANPSTRNATLDALLAVRTKIDAAKLTPLLADTATALVASNDPAQLDLGIKLAGSFKLTTVEPALVAMLSRAGWASRPLGSAYRGTQTNGDTPANSDVPRQTRGTAGGTPALAILRALAEIGSQDTALFTDLATNAADSLVRDAALDALASSKSDDAPQRVLSLYAKLAASQRRTAIEKLTATKLGATAVVAAVTAGTLPKADLDAAALDRLLAVLGDKDPALSTLVQNIGALLRPVLALDGTDAAWTQLDLTLDGPFTVECWIKLEPGIDNRDGILGLDGALDINFAAEQFRVWAGKEAWDTAIAKKKTTPGIWTHVAASRTAEGKWKVYLDGELSEAGAKPAAHPIVNPRIGYTIAPGGTHAALAEYRIWKGERPADEIRANFDRSLDPQTASILFSSANGWGKLQPGAKIIKTSDLPPILTHDEAIALDAKFSKYRALAAQPGDAARGKTAAMVCSACHLFKGEGGQIGPNLSGVGAMGVEAILRNIITPNAAMESAYRIYRIEMKSGDLVDAFFVSDDKDAVVIRLPGSPDRRIAKSEIDRAQFLRRSLMPEGMLDAMTPQQVSDLFAYLATMK